MKYNTTPARQKVVTWDTGDPTSDGHPPTLAEMIEAAQKEFPGVCFEKLVVEASGYEAEIIELKPQESF